MKGEDRIKRYPYMHTSMWAGMKEWQGIPLVFDAK